MKKLILFATLLMLTSAVQTYAQAKTDTPSLCVKFKFSDKNPNYVGQEWANQDYPPCKAAVYWLKEAAWTVLGNPLTTDADFVLQKYLLDIGSKSFWKAKFEAGFKQKDAVEYLRQTAKPDEYRIGQIFQEIYGREITVFEDSAYKKGIRSKLYGYLNIYQNEFEKLFNNPQETEVVIQRAFQTVKKRPATPDEIKHWKNQGKVYKDLVAALQK